MGSKCFLATSVPKKHQEKRTAGIIVHDNGQANLNINNCINYCHKRKSKNFLITFHILYLVLLEICSGFVSERPWFIGK